MAFSRCGICYVADHHAPRASFGEDSDRCFVSALCMLSTCFTYGGAIGSVLDRLKL
jgi:hypothetical protein